jgi:hypothetical protein
MVGMHLGARGRAAGVAAVIFVAALALSHPVPAKTIDGYWLSDGYGALVELKGDRLQLYEITPISCIPPDAMVKKAGPANPRGDQAGRDSSTLSAP